MKKKIAALTLVLILAFAAFAGCNKDGKIQTTKKLKIDNYAYSLDSTLYGENILTENAGFTSASRITDGYLSGTGNAKVAALCVGDGAYKLYDSETGTLSSASYSRIEFVNVSAYSQMLPDVIKAYGETGETVALLDYQGNTLLAADEYEFLDVDAGTYYVNGKKLPDVVLTVKYGKNGDEKYGYKYFAYLSDGTAPYVLSEVKESDIRTTPNDTSIGAVINGAPDYPIYTNLLGQVVEGFDEYTYSTQTVQSGTTGNKINVTFYKSGNRSGQVNIENGTVLGVMDKYLYYAEAEKLPFDAKSGYNVYAQSSSSFTTAAKYKFTYYKYDFKKNKTSSFNPGYFIIGMVPLYNRNSKSYDAALVEAVDFVNGVAVLEQSNEKIYVVDTSFKVGFDLSDKPFSLDAPVLKLKNNRYLIDDYIVDSKLNIVAALPETDEVYKDSQLVTFTHNGLYGAVDFDGKVAFEAKYSNLDLVGGIALADVTDSLTETNSRRLVSKDVLDGTAADDLLSSDEEWLGVALDGILVKRNYATGSATVYNYAGASILTLSDISSVSYSGTSEDLKIVTFVTTSGEYVSYKFNA